MKQAELVKIFSGYRYLIRPTTHLSRFKLLTAAEKFKQDNTGETALFFRTYLKEKEDCYNNYQGKGLAAGLYIAREECAKNHNFKRAVFSFLKTIKLL